MSHLKARPLSSKRLKKSTDNSNPLTIQQYNNFINIDTSKNNITIDEERENKHLNRTALPLKISIKTSPSPMKNLIPTKKPNFSTDRYVVDSLPSSLFPSSLKNTPNSSNLLHIIKNKLSTVVHKNKKLNCSYDTTSSFLDKKLFRNHANSKPQKNNDNQIFSHVEANTALKKNASFNETFHNLQKTLKPTSSPPPPLSLLSSLLSDFLSTLSSSSSSSSLLGNYMESLLEVIGRMAHVAPNLSEIFEKLRCGVEVVLAKSMESLVRMREMLEEGGRREEEGRRREGFLRGRINHLEKERESFIKREVFWEEMYGGRREEEGRKREGGGRREEEGDRRREDGRREEEERGRREDGRRKEEGVCFDLGMVERVWNENVKMKESLKKCRKEMKEGREKEQKIMKLLYAIRKKGIDIESIYKDEVTEKEEEGGREEEDNRREEETEKSWRREEDGRKREEEMWMREGGDKEEGRRGGKGEGGRKEEEEDLRNMDFKKKVIKEEEEEEEEHDGFSVGESEVRNDFYDDESFNFSKSKTINKNIEPLQPSTTITKTGGLKDMLKLNLSPLDFKKCENVTGFHEEFMGRLDEFSQSWRMAAMAEKKF